MKRRIGAFLLALSLALCLLPTAAWAEGGDNTPENGTQEETGKLSDDTAVDSDASVTRA